jgi:hypothetical protein
MDGGWPGSWKARVTVPFWRTLVTKAGRKHTRYVPFEPDAQIDNACGPRCQQFLCKLLSSFCNWLGRGNPNGAHRRGCLRNSQQVMGGQRTLSC